MCVGCCFAAAAAVTSTVRASGSLVRMRGVIIIMRGQAPTPGGTASPRDISAAGAARRLRAGRGGGRLYASLGGRPVGCQNFACSDLSLKHRLKFYCFAAPADKPR
eukprot:COSAG01_NODE_411_length_17360_cov_11.401852_1_plen_106_part_00